MCKSNEHCGKLLDIIEVGDLDEFREYFSADNSSQNSVFQIATRMDSYDIAEYLLTNGADPNQGSPLCEVVESGFFKMAKLLLENKANVLVNRNDPNEPFNNACREGRLDMIKLLIEHKALPSDESFAWTCQAGRVDCVEFLYGIGAPIGNANTLYLYTGSLEVFRFLVSKKIFPTKVDKIMRDAIVFHNTKTFLYLASVFRDRKLNWKSYFRVAYRQSEIGLLYIMVESFGMKMDGISDSCRNILAKMILEKYVVSRKLRKQFSRHLEMKYAFGGEGYLEAERRFNGIVV